MQPVVLMNRPCNYMAAAAGVLIKFVQINASTFATAPILTHSASAAAELTPHTKQKKCAVNKSCWLVVNASFLFRFCCKVRTYHAFFFVFIYCACNGMRFAPARAAFIFMELAALRASIIHESLRECVTLAAGWTRPLGTRPAGWRWEPCGFFILDTALFTSSCSKYFAYWCYCYFPTLTCVELKNWKLHLVMD